MEPSQNGLESDGGADPVSNLGLIHAHSALSTKCQQICQFTSGKNCFTNYNLSLDVTVIDRVMHFGRFRFQPWIVSSAVSPTKHGAAVVVLFLNDLISTTDAISPEQIQEKKKRAFVPKN
jgi:hypothetical protein